MERDVPAKTTRTPTPLLCFAHLAVLWSFAFAQPLFDILADSPEFFVARENTAGDIVVLALAVTLLPPAALWLVELALSRVPRARWGVHLLFVGLLAAAIAIQLLKDVSGSPSALLAPLALALGAAGALAYERAHAVRLTLSVLTPLPLVFLAAFLAFSPVSELVLPEGDDSTEAQASSLRPIPIVMVVFDELSGGSLMDARGRLDATRYPSFARLARDATWYRNATTVADSTARAVPAILTGSRPGDDELPTSSDHPDSLFTFLGERYDLSVQEPITELCPSHLCSEEPRDPAGRRLRDLASDLSLVSLHRLLPDDLREDLPAVDQAFGDFADRPTQADQFDSANAARLDHRPEAFERFVGAIGRRSARPTLDFAHVELPHVPWEYLPSGQQYGTSDSQLPGLADEVWTREPRLVIQGQQRYLLQLAYADRLLGRLLDRLRRTGLYRRTLIVVAADHGVAFRPGAHRRAVSSSTFGAIAGVPLLVKAPGQREGRADDLPARTIDILPTVAEHLGTKLPWRPAGRSLRRAGRRSVRSLSVATPTGSPVVMSFARFTGRRDSAVARDTGFLGSADRGQGIFAPGPDAGLMGRPAGGIPTEPGPPGARVSLDDPRAFSSVRRNSAVLPVFVGGSILGQAGAVDRIAVAVNGRIAAVTHAFGPKDARRFEAIVDPRALTPGRNEVRVLAVRGEGAARRLVSLALAGSETYRLSERGQRDVVVDSSGARIPVATKTAAGFLDRIERDGAVLRLSGWSAIRERGAADRVLVFADGRFLVAGAPSLARPDVARALGASGVNSGFAIRAYSRTGRGEPAGELRAFGLIDGRAYELENKGGER